MVSAGGRLVWVTFQTKFVAAVPPRPSSTVTVTLFTAAAPKAMLPLIRPVNTSSDKPPGRPSAV